MDAPDTKSTEPVTVLHPDFTEGDIELVPADRTCCFRVLSSTLRRTSPFFSDMFSNSQPDGAQVALSEDKETVRMLLSVANGLSLPIDKPGDMDCLERLAYAAEKYEMRVVLDLVRLVLWHKELQRPELALRRYALATHFAWADLAREALIAALDVDLSSAQLPPTMSARELAGLVSLRDRRVRLFVEQIDYTLKRACSCPLSACSDPEGICWPELKQAMVLAMMSRPSGSSVLTVDAGAVDNVRLVTCESRRQHSGKRYLWAETQTKIQALIARLPSTL